MRVEFKRVFHCDYCEEYRLRHSAIVRHESTCIRNPDRECKYRGINHKVNIEKLSKKLKDNHSSLTWLETATKYCPVCTLSVIYHAGMARKLNWSYAEAKRKWEAKQEEV